MVRFVAVVLMVGAVVAHGEPRKKSPLRPYPRYEPPAETFGTPRQLQTLQAEIGQTPAQAAARLDGLLREQGTATISLDGADLVSVAGWVDMLDDAQRQKLIPEYRRQFDAKAKEALAALQQDPTSRSEDFYLLARRWPLSSSAAVALVEAGDRASAAGDAHATSAYYQLARRAGWTPDEARSVVLAVAETTCGESPAALTPAARKRVAELQARKVAYRGLVPADCVWYDKPEGVGLARYIPLASDGVLYLVGPRQVQAVREAAQPLWSWSPVAWHRDYRPDRTANVGRGATVAASASWGPGGAQILVVRQPEGNSRDNCLRALRASDGKLLWDTQASNALDDCSFIGNPAVAGRYVYATALIWANESCSLAVVALDVLDGRVLWRSEIGSMRDMPRHRDDDRRHWDGFWEQTEPCVAGDLVCVTPSVGWAFVLGRFDGSLRWAREYLPPPEAERGRADFRPGMRRFGGNEERWTMPASTAQLTRWTTNPRAVNPWGDSPALVAAPQDVPWAMAWNLRTGKRLWQENEPMAPTLIGTAGDCAVFAGPFLHGVDALTGRTRWRFGPPSGTPITGPPALVGHAIYIPTPGEYLCISAIDGAKIDPPAKVPNWRFVAATETGKRLLEDSQTLRSFGLPPGRR